MPDILPNFNTDLDASDATISPLHKAARAYVEAGLTIFACEPGGKKPANAHGCKEWLTSIDEVDRVWGAADYNIGLALEPLGWCAVDLDPDSDEAWSALLVEHGAVAPDIEQVTPRGGRHLIFAGSLPPTASKLGPHIDTRGRGSYIVIAPSAIGDNAYRVASGDFVEAMLTGLPQVPTWIEQRLATAHGGVTRTKRTGDLPDFPGSVGRATTHLEGLVDREDIAIEGSGGDDRTYKLACTIIGLGCSEETAVDLITEHWDLHCQPPWGRDGIAMKVAGACSYMQEDQGHLIGGDPRGAKDTFGASAAALAAALTNNDNATVASPGNPSRFRLMPRGEYRYLPLPCWLFEGLLPERGIALLVGHSQALKSFIAIDLAASVATGARAFNSLKPSKTGAAIYIAGEGQHGFKSQRVPAWEKVRSVSLSEAPFYLVENMPLAAGGDQFEELAAEITKGAGAARVRLIVLDTLATMAGALKENDAGDMGLCMAAAGMLARRFDCCVVVVHHPAKAARGEEIDPRGSGNLTAAADSIILAVRDGSGLRTKLVTQKQKDGETGGAVFLEGETVELATNAQGQRITSLALHTVTGEAFESAGDDLLAHVETALGRLGARGDATAVTTGRLARHMLQMQCPEIEPEGTALNPVQDRRLETIRENLRRQTGSARFAHIAMKIGRAKKAPWMWRLPYADAG